MISLYNNFILAIGAAKKLFVVEIIKDALIFIAILSTMWSGNLSLIVWGQFIASALTWIIVLGIASRVTNYSPLNMVVDLLPSLGVSIIMSVITLACLFINAPAPVILIIMIAVGGVAYIAFSKVFRLPELSDAASYLLGRLKK